jgi:hypothetical protein
MAPTGTASFDWDRNRSYTKRSCTWAFSRETCRRLMPKVFHERERTSHMDDAVRQRDSRDLRRGTNCDAGFALWATNCKRKLDIDRTTAVRCPNSRALLRARKLKTRRRHAVVAIGEHVEFVPSGDAQPQRLPRGVVIATARHRNRAMPNWCLVMLRGARRRVVAVHVNDVVART